MDTGLRIALLFGIPKSTANNRALLFVSPHGFFITYCPLPCPHISHLSRKKVNGHLVWRWPFRLRRKFSFKPLGKLRSKESSHLIKTCFLLLKATSEEDATRLTFTLLGKKAVITYRPNPLKKQSSFELHVEGTKIPRAAPPPDSDH